MQKVIVFFIVAFAVVITLYMMVKAVRKVSNADTCSETDCDGCKNKCSNKCNNSK